MQAWQQEHHGVARWPWPPQNNSKQAKHSPRTPTREGREGWVFFCAWRLMFLLYLDNNSIEADKAVYVRFLF